MIVLVAGWFDVLTPLVPVILFAIYSLAQALSEKNRPPGRPGRARPDGRPQAEGQPPQKDLASEIEAFLKRAARQRQGDENAGQAKVEVPPATRPPERSERPAGRPATPGGARRPPAPRPRTATAGESSSARNRTQSPRPAETGTARPAAASRTPNAGPSAERPSASQPAAAGRGQTPTAHPADLAPDSATLAPDQQRLGGRRFAQREVHLGESLELTDERIEARLRKTFDHRVGHLPGGQEDTSYHVSEMETAYERSAVQGVDVKAEIMASLQHPAGLRHLIVLQEILRRPTENW